MEHVKMVLTHKAMTDGGITTTIALRGQTVVTRASHRICWCLIFVYTVAIILITFVYTECWPEQESLPKRVATKT